MPVTPGSVTAFAQFESTPATGTESAPNSNWPVTLARATVAVIDSAGISRPAQISYASPRQVNYRVPPETATGLATVRFTAAGITVMSALKAVPVYPGLFKLNMENAAAEQVARFRGGQVVYEPVTGPIMVGPASEQATLILYGTGFNSATPVTATIGGIALPVAYDGPQGAFPGLDQVNIPLPSNLAGADRVDSSVTAAQKAVQLGEHYHGAIMASNSVRARVKL